MAVDKSLTEIFPEDILMAENTDIEFPVEDMMEAFVIEDGEPC
jgi:hypothetical protein